MGVVGELVKALTSLHPHIEKIKVENVIIGLSYTCVQVSTGHVGLCHTLLGELNISCCKIAEKAGSMAGSRVADLLEMANSWDLGERVVGMATINALSAQHIEGGGGLRVTKGNILERLEVKKDDVVVMAGNMRPLKQALKARGCRLLVFDRNPLFRDEETLPDTLVDEAMEKADVVLASGTSLANGTIDRVLRASRNARCVALIGPSAGAYPQVLLGMGATMIGCIRVLNPSMVMRVVSEGGGTKALKPYVEQVTIEKAS
ncbi:MAG: DUF364 domain-containing protein [Candidatus Nezhaarchaeota archaeon]|nr:DUF364 domain-containing protein [Candidatus Nezhaarchaeota archaeon]